MDATQYNIFKKLQATGQLNNNAIAGIMGNMQAESNFNPHVLFGGGEANEVKVGGNAYGLIQWADPSRQQGLLDYAQSSGRSSGDIDVQIEYLLKELGPEGIAKLNAQKTPYDSAMFYHDDQERSGDTPELKARRGNFAEQLAKGVGLDYSMPVGNGTLNLPMNFQQEDPNEKLDLNTAMSVLMQPKRNVADASMQALQEQLLNQAHHKARGVLAAPFYKDSDEMMMKAAMAKAEEEAKMQNQSAQLTGAGKLAQMIANSKNNSNRAMLASLAALAGTPIDPMQNQYVGANKMAEMALGFAREDYNRDKDFEMYKKKSDYDFGQKLALMSMGGGGGGSRGGGSGRAGGQAMGKPLTQSQRIAGYEFAEKALGAFSEELQNIANEEVEGGFKQHHIDQIDNAYRELLGKVGLLDPSPAVGEILRRGEGQRDFLVKYMQDSPSGNQLDWHTENKK